MYIVIYIFWGSDSCVNYKHEGVTCWHMESIIFSMTSPPLLSLVYDVYAWRDVAINIGWIIYKWLFFWINTKNMCLTA